MKENKLVSMVDFVLEQNKFLETITDNYTPPETLSSNIVRLFLKQFNYAKFFKKLLELGQFIPCKDGVPLEEPEGYKEWLVCSVRKGYYPVGIHCEEYQEAKERILFDMDKDIYYDIDTISVIPVIHNTVEDLLKLEGITLTETAMKLI